MFTFRKLALMAAFVTAAAAMNARAATNLFILPQTGQGGQISVYNSNPLSSAATISLTPPISDPAFALMNPAGTRAYIIGRSGTVVVLNASSGFTEIARYSLSAQVSAAVITPDGSKLLALAGALRPINLATDVPANIPEVNVGPLPNDMAVSLDSTKAYITSASGRTVTVIDLTNNQRIAQQVLPGTPSGVGVSPNGLVYVAASNALYEIDGREGITFTVPGGFAFVGEPGKPAFTADGSRVVMITTTPGVASSAIVVDVNGRTVAQATGPIPLRNLVVASGTRAFALGSNGIVYSIPIAPVQSPGLSPIGTLDGTVSIALSDESPAARYLFGQTTNNIYRIDLQQSVFTGPQPTTSPAESIVFVGTPSTSAAALQQTMLTAPVQPTSVSFPIAVRAVDTTGRPVSGIAIQYTTSGSGVVLQASSATTNSQGLASVRATMPGVAGTYTIRATGASGGSIDIPIQVRPAGEVEGGFTRAGGQGQIVTAGSTAVGFQVLLRDNTGAPIAGTTVNWVVKSGLGVSPLTPTSVTDAQGIATGTFSTSIFTPSQLEQYRTFSVEASISGSVAAALEFFAVAIPPDMGLNVQLENLLQRTNNEYLLPAGALLNDALRVTVLTSPLPASGLLPVPVPNVGIRATTPDTSTPFVRCTGDPVTTGSGVTICNLQVGNNTGQATMNVIVGERAVNTYPFPIRVIPGAPSSLTIIQGDGQSGAQGETTPRALVVEVKDVSGNPLSGVEITWTIASGSGTLVNPRNSTDNSGRASAQVQFGPVPGTVAVRATSGSLQANFTLTNTTAVGNLTLSAGSPQSAPINAAFPVPLTVRLANTAGQPVAGTIINFVVTSGPVTVSAATATTNNEGLASVTATAGNTTGAAVVTASLGAMSVPFQLTVTTATPRIDSLLNGASFLDGGSPCSIGIVRGGNFAPTLNGVLSATLGPIPVLPLTLGGVSVQFNGIGAPIFYVSNVSGVEQVAVQIPCELQPGPVTVSVNSSVGTTNREFTLADIAPGVFETEFTPGVRQGVVLRPNGSYVSPTNPAVRGETVTGFFTGLGPIAGRITNAPGTGQTLQTDNVIVGVNHSGMPVISASYAPNLIGVYAVRFQISELAGAGSAQPYAIAIRNAQGQNIFGQGSTLPVAAQ